MPEIDLGPKVEGPGTHALVIGVSHYPYLAGPAASPFGQQFGMEGDLTSAAMSASAIAAWLLDEYLNPDAPLASLRILLSPTEGERLHQGVTARLPARYAATRDAVEQDLLGFRGASQAPGNVAFVYVAGHGIQLTKRGAIVLLEDFANPDRVELYGAIDMVGCHAGLDGIGYADNQFWFVDACRQVPAVARLFEELSSGVLSLLVPPGKVECSPLYLASTSRELAFAEVGGTTLFSQAVLSGLRGAAAAGPEDDLRLGWHVPAARLGDVVKDSVAALAAANGEDQSVDPIGWPGRAVVHRFKDPPSVRLVLSLDPAAAADHARVSLLLNADDAQKVIDGAADWPLERELPAGAYQIRVSTTPPYLPIDPKLVNMRPLEYVEESGAAMTGGTLRISFESSSAFLGSKLPVEVRDAQNRLVKRTTGSLVEAVPAGLYVVEATVPGGGRHSEVVEVRPHAETDIVLSRAGIHRRPRIRADLLSPDEIEARVTARPIDGDVALISQKACELRERGRFGWVFEPMGNDPNETPVATFNVAGTTVDASLPVNPRGMAGERGCVVNFVQGARRVRVDVGFVRQRRVAWTLEGLVKSGDVVSTAEVFRNADEVLFRKYQDPSAAALGGLALHRMGRLPDRSRWVENLSRDFAWIADGRILRAALLSIATTKAQRERGLDLLLETAPSRPLFSDGLALLIRLLRAWPDESRTTERRDALKAITSKPMTVDWDAMALTMYGET